ncbi:glycosyltransferase family 87 protein [Futiania mangrovi]|uniref:DUF2029 domain-containing protein n=1 Tax=Futiania mangrovi TaxID=2959716 RepID=A0A9J6PCT9_9PROT|nr:glycosyltransferase family 87 protein [Futiania mangrovii]MCP1336377.1 DUF2029 domain-containing protein [Futiania mangrovii]
MAPIPAPLFDADRMRVYPWIFAAAYLVSAIALVMASSGGIDPWGKPLGYDFITFWSAGHLTLEGRPEAAFDAYEILAAQQVAVPQNTSIFLWHYPPTYQLLVAPLALVPYFASYLLFTGLTLAAYLLTVSRLLDQKGAVMLVLAAGGTWMCVFHGQNSMLSAALFAGIALTIGRRPVLAGVLIGLLAYKPQLGLLIPFALIVTGQWRTFAAAAATTLVFAGGATLAFGLDLWRAFLDNMPLVGTLLESGFLPWEKIPSLFVTLRLLGVPEGLAYAAHWTLAAAAALTAIAVWRKAGPGPLSVAVLVLATLLMTPYLFDYEFAIVSVPLVIAATHMARAGASRAEKAVLLFAYFAPFLMIFGVKAANLQLGFFALLALFAVTVHRALAEARTREAAHPAAAAA